MSSLELRQSDGAPKGVPNASVPPRMRAYSPPPPASLPEAWQPPLYKDLLQERQRLYTPSEKAHAFRQASETIRSYSDETVERWNKEIKDYLILAGLLSAVMTEFSLGAYDYLEEKTPADIFWPNILWFCSLILSLASASIGIMVKQWLGMYASRLSSESSRDIARLRQYRLNNLLHWRVGVVVATIPFLLQLALVSFLSGLIVFIWAYNYTVATIAIIPVGLLGAFMLVTTLLPAFKPTCAYLSPLALAIDALLLRSGYTIRRLSLALCNSITALVRPDNTNPSLAGRLLSLVAHAADRAKKSSFLSDGKLKPPRSRPAREQGAISALSDQLHCDLIVMAYNVRLADPKVLNIVAPYLADMKETIVVQTFRRLQAVAAKHLGPSGSTPPAIALAEFPSFALWWDIMLCGDSDPKETRAMLSKPLLESLQYYLHETLSAGTRLQHDDALRYTQWICRVISAAMCNQAFQQIGDREDDSGPLFPAAFLRLQAEQLLTGDRQLGVEDGAIKYLAAAADRQLNAMLPHRGWQPSRTLGLGDCITLSFILVLCTIRISAAPQVSQDRATLSTRTSEVLSHVSEALRITGCQTAFPNTESLQSVVDSLRGLRKCLVRDSQPYPSSPSPIPEDLLPRIKEFLSTLRQVCSSGGLGYGRTERAQLLSDCIMSCRELLDVIMATTETQTRLSSAVTQSLIRSLSGSSSFQKLSYDDLPNLVESARESDARVADGMAHVVQSESGITVGSVAASASESPPSNRGAPQECTENVSFRSVDSRNRPEDRQADAIVPS